MTNYRIIRDAGGLGDAVRVLAVCQSIKINKPNARVHFFGPSYLTNLFAGRSPGVDVFFPCDVNSRPRDIYATDEYPCLNPPGIKYSQTVDCWCPAYIHEPATRGIVAIDRTELFCRNAGVGFVRPKMTFREQDLEIKKKYIKNFGNKIVGIQVGATCPSREWPYEKTGKLINILKKSGYHVILFDVCTRSFAGIDTKQVELSIEDTWINTLGKLAACQLIITPDSGFFHLAGCFELPTVGIFGCTSGIVTSRPWQIKNYTHTFVQLGHDQINYALLPAECKPICNMQYLRGFRGDRYRLKNGRAFCELMHQTSVEMVLDHIEGRLLKKDKSC